MTCLALWYVPIRDLISDLYLFCRGEEGERGEVRKRGWVEGGEREGRGKGEEGGRITHTLQLIIEQHTQRVVNDVPGGGCLGNRVSHMSINTPTCS